MAYSSGVSGPASGALGATSSTRKRWLRSRRSRMARRFTRLTPSAKYSTPPMNGDSQAMPIHEIDVPMLRLYSRTWIVTALAMATCTSAASSPSSQARSPLKVTLR